MQSFTQAFSIVPILLYFVIFASFSRGFIPRELPSLELPSMIPVPEDGAIIPRGLSTPMFVPKPPTRPPPPPPEEEDDDEGALDPRNLSRQLAPVPRPSCHTAPRPLVPSETPLPQPSTPPSEMFDKPESCPSGPPTPVRPRMPSRPNGIPSKPKPNPPQQDAAALAPRKDPCSRPLWMHLHLCDEDDVQEPTSPTTSSTPSPGTLDSSNSPFATPLHPQSVGWSTILDPKTILHPHPPPN